MRALRPARDTAGTMTDRRPARDHREVIADVRPSAHAERLELMDLLAVKECTDTRFLPPRFRSLTVAQVNRRLAELRHLIEE